MSTTNLTSLQITELRKKYRYIKFVPDAKQLSRSILVGSNDEGKEKKWVEISIPAPSPEPERTTIKLYEHQILDLQQYR